MLSRIQRPRRVTVEDTDSGQTFVVNGEISGVVGRHAALRTSINLDGRRILSIASEGPDGPTNADRARSLAVLGALQGQSNLIENPFLKYIFDPSEDFAWPDTFPIVDDIPPIVTQRALNDSQERAVNHMLSNTNDTRMTIIQGPPGTGVPSSLTLAQLYSVDVYDDM